MRDDDSITPFMDVVMADPGNPLAYLAEHYLPYVRAFSGGYWLDHDLPDRVKDRFDESTEMGLMGDITANDYVPISEYDWTESSIEDDNDNLIIGQRRVRILAIPVVDLGPEFMDYLCGWLEDNAGVEPTDGDEEE